MHADFGFSNGFLYKGLNVSKIGDKKKDILTGVLQQMTEQEM